MFNGGGNMAGMMKKVQKMQADMKKMQDELRKKTVEVSSGGGAVKVVMDGEKQVQSLIIAPAAVDPEDIEMLQDLISAAFNEATKKVDDMMAQEMGKLTSGLGLLALRRGATFFAAGRGRDRLNGRRGLVAVVFVSSKHAPRLADRPPAVHCHGLPCAYG